MSAGPLFPESLSPRAVALVSPVIDYEPPLSGERPRRSAARAVGTRRRPAPPPAETRGQLRAAATFADAALRRVLEVLDRRRPLAQLRPLLAPGLLDSLLTGAGDAGRTARLQRVRTQLTRPDGTAAEVSAHYTRGQRVHALACRVEQVITPTGPRWQVVALLLG
ncbi:MAG: Rv3235 family protein [Mycobacterium sp.]